MSFKIVADDYGMSPEINCAISELVSRGIISRVSVMASRSAECLRNDFDGKAEAGLHVNLTTDTEIIGLVNRGNVGLLKLIFLIYAGRLDVNNIAENIKHQSDVLIKTGIRIGHLDTHQHIHIIPKVLDSLILYAKTAGITSIRCITLERKHILFYFNSLIRYGFILQVPKMTLLYFMGRFMKKKLDRSKIQYCKNLILMPLATGGNYEELLKAFIDKFKAEDAEIVSHPGLEADRQVDSYTAGRLIEYRALMNHGRF